MNKFKCKAFEAETLSNVYEYLDGLKAYYRKYNEETNAYDLESDYPEDAEKIAIIDGIMSKIEKML